MNLAYKYPLMFWNCACLISDAGGEEQSEEEQTESEIYNEPTTYYNEMEDFSEDDSDEDVEDSYDEGEDCDGYPVEVCKMKNGKKKKKAKVTNFGKIAAAIGKIKVNGVEISPPNINSSTYTFSPDLASNTIRFGMSGITNIGENLVKTIIANRPYSSVEDFLRKVKINKTQMIMLIKCGAFDELGESREKIMQDYIISISETKKRLTLQNVKMLIDYNLLPDELKLEQRVFNFNKYIKKSKYKLDANSYRFVEELNLMDDVQFIEQDSYLNQAKWEARYKKYMEPIKAYINKNQAVLLDKLNTSLIREMWDKYCMGSISKWEMDSINCYIHTHELADLDMNYLGFSNFGLLGQTPNIERYVFIKGKQVPLFKLERICGTVIDKNKQKKTVTIITNDGYVVLVKAFGVFEQYDKQISEIGDDGKKHVIEKSMFKRGNKIIITGIRRDDDFIAKTYSRTPYHKIEQIIHVNDSKDIVIKRERGEVK